MTLFDEILSAVTKAQHENKTYAEVMGPLIDVISRLGAAAAVQNGETPTVISDIICHEIDASVAGYYDQFRSNR